MCMSSDDLLVFNGNNEEGKLFNFVVLQLFLNGGMFMTWCSSRAALNLMRDSS